MTYHLAAQGLPGIDMCCRCNADSATFCCSQRRVSIGLSTQAGASEVIALRPSAFATPGATRRLRDTTGRQSDTSLGHCNAMPADGQLALGGRNPRRQDGFGLHQCQEGAERTSEKLPDGLNGSGGVPQQVLKGVHGRRTAIPPQNGEIRKSLQDKRERIIRADK